MTNITKNFKPVSINQCLKKINVIHRQRLGIVGPYLGMGLILLFAFFLLPLFIFLVLFNYTYFWIRRQKRIDPGPFFNFDRHKIAHISIMDRIWCEYCEWANGSLQWALAITNEIERRYCPIKNKCDPHCEKAKNWRSEFLNFQHQPEEIEKYYKDSYLKNNNS